LRGQAQAKARGPLVRSGGGLYEGLWLAHDCRQEQQWRSSVAQSYLCASWLSLSLTEVSSFANALLSVCSRAMVRVNFETFTVKELRSPEWLLSMY